MDAAFASKVIDSLKAQFRFKKAGSGKWLQEGQCPDCQRWEVFCAAVDPKVVTCGRPSCGYQESVREVLPDLFEDWSKRAPTTAENPNASAEEYLRSGRGLDLAGLRGHFNQELYREGNAVTATVRFPVGPDAYWERLIDRPGRFGNGKMKARFKPGASIGGHCWAHPEDNFAALAAMDEIWIAEGIFDALSLRQNFKRLERHGRKVKATAVSAMSCNFWPEHFLAGLRDACSGQRRTPELVFAFDVGSAGVEAMREFSRRARREHWEAGAAIVTVDGEGAKRDWNDLLQLQFAQRDESARGPLSSESLEHYRQNGAITLAETPQAKADLLSDRLKLASFDFRFNNRTYWASRSSNNDDEDNGGEKKKIAREIANCAFRVLYQERDDIEDETTYFLQVDFPGKLPTRKARFSHAALADSGGFKKRLMAFAGTWSGNGEQLDRIVKNQPGLHKVVAPIKFTGYSADHKAWVLGDIAVREGRVYAINRDKFFDFGKQAVKLRSDERLLSIRYDADQLAFDWLPDLWAAYGEKGMVALAFFALSLFAQQVRNAPLWHSSFPFLEITGIPGSGKTTLVVFLQKLLGRGSGSGHEGFDPNKVSPAAFGRYLMRIANLPEGLIEGGRDDDKSAGRKRFDYNELLVLYDGRNPRATGQKTSGYEINEQPFLGTLYLMQNERIEAHQAVLERLISMNIDKARHSEANRASADRLKRWPLDEVSGTVVHIARAEAAFLAFFAERFAHHEASMRRRLAAVANDRIIKNHAQLAAAVDALPRLFPGMRPEWVAATLAQVNALAVDRQNSVATDHPVVERFWGIFDYLCAMEAEDAEHPVNLHRGSELIAVNLNRFMESCRARGQVPPTEDELKKHLKGSKSRKFIGQRSVNSRLGKGFHCWVFQRPPSEQPVI